MNRPMDASTQRHSSSWARAMARSACASRYFARRLSRARRATTLTPLAVIPNWPATAAGEVPSTAVCHRIRWSRSGSRPKATRTSSWSTDELTSCAATDGAAASRLVSSVGTARSSVRAKSTATVFTVDRKYERKLLVGPLPARINP